MALLTSTEKLQEAFSVALETRTPMYQDLISNSNAIWHAMKERGMWKTFSGPSIRVPLLYAESDTYIRYAGSDFLSTSRAEILNSAEFTPVMGAVSVVLTSEEILKTNGRNEIKSRMALHIEAAEQELKDRFVEDLHSDGTESNQIGGLQKAIPTTVNSGTYGGIDRSSADAALWRTTAWNIHTFTSSYGIYDTTGTAITQASKNTIQPIFRHVVEQRSRYTQGPNMLVASTEHFSAYANATEAIQRINDENSLGKLGFANLKFYGVGKSIPVILEGGIGSAMPSDTTYAIDSKALCFYYHPERNFAKFGGKQMPINQDMVVQHIGFMGELCLLNPLHMAKIYDPTPGS